MEDLIFKVHQDDCGTDSPRDWDNLGTMICSHRNYTLGDEQFEASEYDGWADLEKSLKEQGANCILPLYLYDHSGISMYTTGDSSYRQHEAWDSGQVGFIYTTAKDIEENFLTVGEGTEQQVKEILESEIKIYSQYLKGDVWGVEVATIDGEHVDSLWGLYGQEAVDEFIEETKANYVSPRNSAKAKKANEVHNG